MMTGSFKPNRLQEALLRRYDPSDLPGSGLILDALLLEIYIRVRNSPADKRGSFPESEIQGLQELLDAKSEM
ncbi:MAG: hypothetical protein D6698_03990 [Gammaproteobacteria bacterium]|nr:MAG: hypothetical protein D6698_03990 [Gammaproteobacteria bacterium]